MLELVLAQPQVTLPIHCCAVSTTQTVVLDRPVAIDERLFKRRPALLPAQTQLIDAGGDADSSGDTRDVSDPNHGATLAAR